MKRPALLLEISLTAILWVVLVLIYLASLSRAARVPFAPGLAEYKERIQREENGGTPSSSVEPGPQIESAGTNGSGAVDSAGKALPGRAQGNLSAVRVGLNMTGLLGLAWVGVGGIRRLYRWADQPPRRRVFRRRPQRRSASLEEVRRRFAALLAANPDHPRLEAADWHRLGVLDEAWMTALHSGRARFSAFDTHTPDQAVVLEVRDRWFGWQVLRKGDLVATNEAAPRSDPAEASHAAASRCG